MQYTDNPNNHDTENYRSQIMSTSYRVPENEYQALMETMPHEEPYEPQDGLMELRDAVMMHVEQLLPREQWIVNALMNEGRSLQSIADELSITKTHVWRLRNQAFKKLKETMSNDTTIRKSVRVATTWDQSAMQWLSYLSHIEPDRYVLAGADIPSLRTWIRALIVAERTTSPEHDAQKLFEYMAVSAINELKIIESWDLETVFQTLCSKQYDYGHENINKFGLYGIIVRLSDKVERYANLKNKYAKNESVFDTLLDIVGYCVVALMLIDKTFNLQLGEDYDRTPGHS
jgi:hypothetical protein